MADVTVDACPADEALGPPPAQTGANAGRWPFVLYGLTGFTGLLAEQGFEKYIALLVGATASASAVVLFTYFLGFALGGLAAARLLNRGRIRRPLLAYGLIEGLVGISCVCFSYSFHALTARLAPLQGLVAGPAMQFQVRFFCGCLPVLPTAALMGASFPLIAAALDAGDKRLHKRWSKAYTANLGGALAAALAAPFAILPLAGLRGALWLCFGINSGVATAAAILSHHSAGRGHHAAPVSAGGARRIRLLLAASFASGAVFFALEVIWTHLIGVVIGCSVYAFSWMLAAILAGLLLGAGGVSRGARGKRPLRPALLFQLSALLLLVQFRLWDFVPLLFRVTLPPPLQESFWAAELYKLGVAALLLVPPATALGLIYPRLLASPQLEEHGNAHLAGYLSAANALGCLTGALCGIFVLLPLAGSELSLKLIVAALALFWLLFVRQESPGRAHRLRTVVTAAAIVLMIGTWHWNWGRLTAGAGNYFGQRPHAATPVPGVQASSAFIVFADESVQGGITTVVEQTVTGRGSARTIHTLLTNGKFQGDDDTATAFGQVQAQFGFAAIPSLFVGSYDRALLIGLGTGHSAAALRRVGYRDLEIAEFSPGIVHAARQCFQELNGDVLASPGVHLHLEDGRNVLLADARTRYDLITIEISSVWFAGSTNLYSKEFYALVRSRLAPGGVLQQWVQFHNIGPRELAAELATVRSVFPYVGLWDYGRQGMMVASGRPLAVSATRRAALAQRFSDPGLVAGLEAARVLGSDGVDRLIRQNRPVINTDHNRWIEYATPRYAASSFDWDAYNRRFLAQYR